MESFRDTFLEYFLGFMFWTSALICVAWWFASRIRPNPVSRLFRLTKRHVVGWTIYLCIGVMVSAVLVFVDDRPTQSQGSPTSEVATAEPETSDLAGETYNVFNASESEDEHDDPAIRRLLDDEGSSVPAMSLHFVDETEIELVYLGETYHGRYTEGGSIVEIEVDSPVFPGGLTGFHYDGYSSPRPLPGGRRSRSTRQSGKTLLKLSSEKYTYYLHLMP